MPKFKDIRPKVEARYETRGLHKTPFADEPKEGQVYYSITPEELDAIEEELNSRPAVDEVKSGE